MKILLDTNIIIHREAHRVKNLKIGQLFYWLDYLGHQKIIHQLTLEELNKHSDYKVVETMMAKAENYQVLKTDPPLSERVHKVASSFDVTENDHIDTILLNQLYAQRVDMLITEDEKIHKKAKELGINELVFHIDEVLRKFEEENPEFIDYKVLSIKKVLVGSINLHDPFFNSLKEDYSQFEKWFNRKAEEDCYVTFYQDKIVGFLYLKVETESEDYEDIHPTFLRKKRLKVGTFKAVRPGYYLGERFLKIIFDNALKQKVDEIYITIFTIRPEQWLLINLIKDWGFLLHGEKITDYGTEQVYVRDFNKLRVSEQTLPKFQFPFIKRSGKFFIITIKPDYHSELFPDSLLRTEDPLDYIEDTPYRNSICKVYVSHSERRDLNPGDTVIIYRIGDTIPRRFSSTITTICIVDSVVDNIESSEEFVKLCRGKTLFDEDALVQKYWNKYPKMHPFVINLLFAHSLPVPKPTLQDLIDLGIVEDAMSIPRGIFEIPLRDFNRLLSFAYNNKRSR